ncbi:MAG: DUF1559 domain-containing protein [Tepidisphaeraceae bacterium]
MRTVQVTTNASDFARWADRCEYLRNGTLLRKIATTIETDRKGIPAGRVGVIAVGPGYRWQANKAYPSASFEMVHFAPPDAEEIFLSERTSCAPLFAYGYLDAIRVDDLLTEKQEGHRLISVAEATLDGKRVIKAISEVPGEGGGKLHWDLYFLPNNWALVGATQRLPGMTFEFRSVYENDDPLRLKSFKRWVVTQDAPGTKTEHLDVDVESLAFRTVPESEFRLTALGLEEPAAARPETRWSPLLWINALIFAGLGIWLAILANRRRRRTDRFKPQSPSAFTLIELLVVIGIIGVLIAILVPTISSARRQGRDVACASNMRQICLALIAYAGQNGGYYPPNSGESGQFWYLEPLIGQHLTAPDRVDRAGAVPAGADASAGLAGGAFVCPNDLDDSVRSYSMNLYASGGVSSGVKKRLDGPNPPGRLFKFGTGKQSSELMLLVESWPELPVKGTDPIKHVAQAIVGLHGKPGERFGGGAGINWQTPPDATPGRFADRDSQITFYRHDRRDRLEEPRGRAHFGFADGHVALLNQGELVTGDKFSSYAALWCPIDRAIESAPPSP